MLTLSVVLGALIAPLGGASDPLPAPTGPSAVGTRVLFLVDRTRPAPRGEGAGRPVVVQLWYPAVAGSGKGAAPYAIDPSLIDLLVDQGYYGQKAELIESWRAIETHARLEAELAQGPLPVLLLSHGLGLSRASYTALAVELASHGYAVAAIDHPCGGATLLEDGSVLTTGDDPELEAHWEERGMEWVADFGFVLDELAHRFDDGQLALERVGVLGHSMGGAAALAAGGRVGRIAACADLDGAPFARTEREGLARPSLFVKSEPDYSDAELAAKGRTRPEGPRTGPWEAITAHGTAPCVYVGFHGTGHMSFSDAPFLMPDTITRFGGKIVPFERAHALLARLLLAFFDVHLRAAPESELLALDAEEELELFALSPAPR